MTDLLSDTLSEYGQRSAHRRREAAPEDNVRLLRNVCVARRRVEPSRYRLNSFRTVATALSAAEQGDTTRLEPPSTTE